MARHGAGCQAPTSIEGKAIVGQPILGVLWAQPALSRRSQPAPCVAAPTRAGVLLVESLRHGARGRSHKAMGCSTGRPGSREASKISLNIREVFL